MEFAKTPLPSPVSVHSVMTAYHLPLFGRPKGGEAHWFQEMVYVSGDRLVILIDGQRTVIEDGQLLIYSPNAYHTGGGVGCHGIADIISFDAESDILSALYNTPITPTVFQRQLLLDIVKDGCEMFVHVSPESGYLGMQLREGVDKLALQSLKNRLELLLIDLYRSRIAEKSGNCQSDTDIRRKKEFESVCSYIEKHLAEELTLERIAHDNSMSVSKLKVLFRSEYGNGAIAYIIDKKLEIAKRLLREEDLDVTETAERLGFSSVHYFSRLFKQKTGISPTEWKSRAN